MDIFTLLKNDHQKVSEMIQKLNQTSDRAMKTRRELFNKLKEELKLHTKVEERVVYSRLKDADENLIKEAQMEHQTVDQLLQQMTKNRDFGEEWKSQLQELRQNVEHHVQMEETEIFDRMRDELPEEEIDELGARFQKAKGSKSTSARRSATSGRKKPAATRR